MKDLAAKEKSKGKRKGDDDRNGRAKWSKPERAAHLECGASDEQCY